MVKRNRNLGVDPRITKNVTNFICYEAVGEFRQLHFIAGTLIIFVS